MDIGTIVGHHGWVTRIGIIDGRHLVVRIGIICTELDGIAGTERDGIAGTERVKIIGIAAEIYIMVVEQLIDLEDGNQQLR